MAVSLEQYNAEFVALTQRVEAIQAEIRQVQAEAEQRLGALQGDLAHTVTRREQVRGAIEALS